MKANKALNRLGPEALIPRASTPEDEQIRHDSEPNAENKAVVNP